MLMTLLKVVIISVLVVYGGHVLWNAYLANTGSTAVHTSPPSALRESKRMYEDMAHTLATAHVQEPAPTTTITTSSEQQPNTTRIGELPTTPDDNQDMQQELQSFMDTLASGKN